MPVSATWKGGEVLVTALVEQPNSPAWDYGDKITVTRTFKGQWATCLSNAAGKGTAAPSPTYSGFFISNCKVQKEPRGAGILTVVYERHVGQANDPLPPDKEGLAPFEANPRVESHPAFATALNDHAFATVDLAINASDEKERAKARDAIMAASGTLPEILSLFNLKKRGVENFYLAGQKYSLTSYYWSEPTFDNGGYLDTPGGTLTLPSGMQWLRQADSLDYSNGRFELTQSWLGAPSGHWDTILYS